MEKKDFLRQKYEEINKLKTLFQDNSKKHINNILISIDKVCDEITGYLESNNKEEIKNKTVDKIIDKNEFTAEELKQFNGENGKPGYIGVNGIVYDISGVKKYNNKKYKNILVGEILTDEYIKSHKDKVKLIKKGKIVGKIIEINRVDKVFTKEELSQYNGKNGMPPYVAVDGIVYDVSKILQWKDGVHYGLMAGLDLTERFLTCHSKNLNIIKNASEVGKLQISRSELPRYTLEEVLEFNGANGRKAYVIIRGTIYDVTDIKKWVEGRHYGVGAGKDLTELFDICHKDEKDILDKLRIIGTLKE